MKIFTILCLSFISIFAQQSSYFFEDFEYNKFPPQQIYDFFTYKANVSAYSVGSGSIMFKDQDSLSEDRLSFITDYLPPTGKSDTLSFDIAYAKSALSYDDSLFIWVGDYDADFDVEKQLTAFSSKDITTSNEVVDSFVPTSLQWKHIKIPVKDTNISIYEFYVKETFKGTLYIDNIKIGTRPKNEIKIVDLIMPRACYRGSVKPKIVIRNMGTEKINVKAGIHDLLDSPIEEMINEVPVDSFYTYEFSPVEINKVDHYYLSARVQTNGELNTRDNELFTDSYITNGVFTIISQSPNKENKSSLTLVKKDDSTFIYQLGGEFENSNKLYKYNLEKNRWTYEGEMPFKLILGSSVYDGDSSIYALGGESNNNFDLLYKYNIVTKQWFKLSANPNIISQGTSMLFNKGKILIVGGQAITIQFPMVYSDKVQVYDIATDSYSTMDAPYAAQLIGADIINDTIYIAGGQYDWWEKYNLFYTGVLKDNSISWTKNEDIPITLAGIPAGIIKEGNSMGFLVGGGSGPYLWNICTQSWEVLPDFAMSFEAYTGGKAIDQNIMYTVIEGNLYRFEIKGLDGNCNASTVAVNEQPLGDLKYSLDQNYPNPFNSSTIIKYTLPEVSNVSLKIYDMLGREIQTLVNEEQNPGSYSFNLNLDNLSSGVYIYKISAGKFSESKKLSLIK